MSFSIEVRLLLRYSHVHQLLLVEFQTTMVSSSSRTNITQRRNKRFTGRDDLLESLHKRLSSPAEEPDSPVCCILHGMGGMGKTQTALEYAFRHQTDYAWRLWVAAETEDKVAESFNTIFKKVSAASPAEMESDPGGNGSVVETTRTWLENSSM